MWRMNYVCTTRRLVFISSSLLFFNVIVHRFICCLNWSFMRIQPIYLPVDWLGSHFTKNILAKISVVLGTSLIYTHDIHTPSLQNYKTHPNLILFLFWIVLTFGFAALYLGIFNAFERLGFIRFCLLNEIRS